MARLADMLAVAEVQPPRWLVIDAKEVNGWRESISAAVDKSQVVVVDEVLEAFFATENPEDWEIGSDFPNLAPLGPLVWLEGRRPARVPGGPAEGAWHNLPSSWGWLCEAHDVGALAGQERKVTPQAITEVRRSLEAYWAMHGAEIDAAIAAHGEAAREQLRPSLRHYYDVRQELAELDAGRPIRHPAAQKWDVRATLFQEGAGHGAEGPLARMDLLLDSAGKVISYFVGPIFSLGAPAQPPMELGALALLLAKPMLLAIALGHCRATRTDRQEAPTRLAKAHERRHGRKPLPYQNLVVAATLDALRQSGAATEGLRATLAACGGDSGSQFPAEESALGAWPRPDGSIDGV
ncbi:MAG: hypothetical protein ACYC4L_09480 [Chloroflexota bacterium]